MRERRFIRLHQAHFEAVRRYVWRRDPGLVDDVVAETFLIAWRRLDEIAEEELPWLIGVARNVRLNTHRAARRQTAVSARLAGAASPAWEAEFVENEVVRAALGKLSPADREVLLLSVWDDLDRSAIAVALGCSRANVSLRLHRARRRFAAALESISVSPTNPVAGRPIVKGASDVC